MIELRSVREFMSSLTHVVSISMVWVEWLIRVVHSDWGIPLCTVQLTVQIAHELNVLIGLSQFLIQLFYLLFQRINQLVSRIIIYYGLICNVRGFCCICEGRYILLKKLIIRIQTGEHQTVRVSTYWLLQNRSEFWISVGNMHFLFIFSFASLGKNTYNLPQSKERFVYVDTLFG
jgi:hypothetical protein